MLTGATGQTVAFPIIIRIAVCTVPVGFAYHRQRLWYPPLQTFHQPDFAGVRVHVRAMLTIPRQTTGGVFKPGPFRVVFRMVLQCTTTQVAGIAVVRGSLCGTGSGQTTVTIERDKGFGVHSIGYLPPDDTQASAVPVWAGWRVN